MVLRKGDTLQSGKFVIEEILGQGGFGITYKAWQPNLTRWVVLKTQNEHLRHDPDWEKYRDRFLKEGQMMEKLSNNPHPNLVRVLDFFAESSAYYLVMNFVEGQDLFKVVRQRGALSEVEVLSIARQIGSALSFMNSHQCVHRDAHPGNIMLQPDGTAILIDLGGAKDFIPSTQSTTGAFGNRGFAPYEQMTRGTRHPTADVYCFAATLYYAVTGEKPVPALSRKLDNAVLTPPTRIRSISKELNQGLLSGMALEAGDRPQTIKDWLGLLDKKTKPKDQVPNGRPSNHRSEGKTQRASSKSASNKLSRLKIAPWLIWSGLCFISYGLIGMTLSTAWAWAWAWIVAVAWAWNGTEDGDGGGDWVMAVVRAVAMPVTMLLLVPFLVAAFVTGAVGGDRGDIGSNLPITISLLTLIELVITAIVGINNSWFLDEAYGSFLMVTWWGLLPITLGFPPNFMAAAIRENSSDATAIILSVMIACLGLSMGWQIMPLLHG